MSDEELNPDGENEIDDNSPEAQKAKLKILQQNFAAEMKKKTEKIKPRLIGCIWMNGDEDENGATMKDLEKKYHCSDIVWKILKAREMWCSGDEIKLDDFEPIVAEVDEEMPEAPVQQKTPAQQKTRPKIEGDESVKELIRLVHGNTNSKKFLIREYQAYRLKNYHNNADFQEYSVKSVEEKMLEVALYKSCPDDGALFGKKCWYVKPEIVKNYFGDERLPIPNQWSYILEKEVKEKKSKQNNENNEQMNGKKGSREVSPDDSLATKMPTPSSSAKLLPSLETKNVKESPKHRPASTSGNSGKKRVQLLLSVPCGGKIDEEKKNNLISQFLSKNNQKANHKKQNEHVDVNVNDDGVVEIID